MVNSPPASALRVKAIPVGSLETNAYLVWCNNDALVFDPGSEPERLLRELAQTGATAHAILLTHTHFDHIGACASLKTALGVPLYVHEAERDWLTNPEQNLSALFGEAVKAPVPDRTFAHREQLRFGNLRVETRHTPGHSPGGTTFWFPDHGVALTGDAIFLGGIGRTDLPGSSQERLLRALAEQILSLPEETRLFPGHGPPTTVRWEKRTNPFLGELREA